MPPEPQQHVERRRRPGPSPTDGVPHWHSAKNYLGLGVLLGIGAPLGFMLLHALRPVRRRLPRPLSKEALALGYMGLATPLVFGLFGRTLGRHEERLRRAVQHAERLREEFAALVAHDLRLPIQSSLLQLQALLPEDARQEVSVPVATLHALHQRGEHLAQMVTDLLDATTIEAARLSVQCEAVSLPDAVRAAIEGIRPTLGARPIEVELGEGVSAVWVDPLRLEQILVNLIENAAKYSQEHAPITVRVRSSEGGHVVSVIDRGVGIAPAELPRLFDRFYQAKRARARKAGLGLGLYITKGLVEAHHGRLDVESEPGRGSVFSVWLPSSPA